MQQVRLAFATLIAVDVIAIIRPLVGHLFLCVSQVDDVSVERQPTV